MRRGFVFGNRSGSILIGLIIMLVIVAVAGAAVVYLTTGSTYAGLLKNNNLEAYYLAESGARFAFPLIQSDLDSGAQTNMKALFGNNLTNTPTYTLSTGTFTLSLSNVSSTSATLTSVGAVNSGWLRTKREDIIHVVASTGPSYPGQSNFSDLNTNWNTKTNLDPNLTGNSFKYDSKNNGLQYENNGKITLTDTGGLLPFSSSNPEIQSLWQAWLAYGNLSYQLQEKVIVDNSKSNFFMIGLSFRVDELDTSDTPYSFYGISFFRKNDEELSKAPLWWWLLVDDKYKIEFDSLKDDTLYMVFWEYLGNGVTRYVEGNKKTCNNLLGTGCYYLLDYSPLTSVVTADGANLLDDSAIVVKVNDVVSGGAHTNDISAYVAQNATPSGPYYYPISTSSYWSSPRSPLWPPSGPFAPISTWYTYPSGKQTPQPIIDNSLTPDAYYTSSTSEIGVHVFYDVNGSNGSCSGGNGCKDLVTDFGMNILSGSSSGGQPIQYY